MVVTDDLPYLGSISTIRFVDYRPLFGPAARALGFVDDVLGAADKIGVRDRLRAQPGGEDGRGQSLQAHVYGEAIARAHAYDRLRTLLGDGATARSRRACGS